MRWLVTLHTQSRSREQTGSGAEQSTLKSRPQQLPLPLKSSIAFPSKTLPPSRDQVFKQMGPWGRFYTQTTRPSVTNHVGFWWVQGAIVKLFQTCARFGEPSTTALSPEHLSSTVTIEEVSGERAEAPIASFMNHRLLSWVLMRRKRMGRTRAICK